jgi:hypothetical protein
MTLSIRNFFYVLINRPYNCYITRHPFYSVSKSDGHQAAKCWPFLVHNLILDTRHSLNYLEVLNYYINSMLYLLFYFLFLFLLSSLFTLMFCAFHSGFSCLFLRLLFVPDVFLFVIVQFRKAHRPDHRGITELCRLVWLCSDGNYKVRSCRFCSWSGCRLPWLRVSCSFSQFLRRHFRTVS